MTAATPLFLAIDLSTKGIDLALITPQAELMDMVTRHVQRQENGAQDPQDWWRAVRTGVKDLLRRTKVRKEDIRAVSVTGDDYGLVCLDEEGSTLNLVHLGPQADLEAYSEGFTSAIGARNLNNLVGGPSYNACPASLAAWVQDEQPRHWHDCAALMNPRGFLNFRLTGQNIIDPSTAASMRLYNPRSGAWSKMVYERLDISPKWLPEVHPGLRMRGRVTATAAKETGLSPGTPVAVGANRTACLAIAAGALGPDKTVLQLGGNGHLTTTLAAWHKPSSPRMEIGCHTVKDCWMLTMREIGHDRFIQWFNQELAATDVQQWRRAGRSPMEMIAEIAAEAPPGSDQLHFIGEPNRGGGLVGLGMHHNRSHVMRALLESVGMRIRTAIDELESTGLEIPEITLVGEGAQNHLWCQIISDVCNRPTIGCERDNPALIGTGILAAAAIGVHKTTATIEKKLAPPTKTFAPRKSAVETYELQVERHEELSSLLTEYFSDQGDEEI